jgi:D-serine deaminase-like pyridoxal phosphate-dependent protein
MNSSLQPLSVGASVFGDEWFRLANENTVRSPALLVYRERVEKNLLRMLAIVGDPSRLRPHIKTHKMAALVERQLALGITKFKCATLREAELAASCGAPDVLVAYQLVGPNVRWLRELARAFPATHFSALVDDLRAARELADTARPIELLLDLDLGQHRTGIEPDAQAADLYRLLASTPGLRAGGLHAYDGHVLDHDPAVRTAACEAAFAPVAKLRAQLLAEGLPVPRVVAGGSSTFAIHARRADVECSPGTCVFWDAGYASKFPDLDFQPAALVLTRIISRPGANRLCLDLGHKAIAAEMPHPRVIFPQLPDVVAISHSEEHLVVETAHAPEFPVGAALYGIPWHICPTVALHAEALVIDHGRVVATWPVGARGRRLEMVVPPVPK